MASPWEVTCTHGTSKKQISNNICTRNFSNRLSYSIFLGWYPYYFSWFCQTFSRKIIVFRRCLFWVNFQRWSAIYLKLFYFSLYNWKLMWKIDVLRFSLTLAVHLSFSHNGGLMQTTPKRSSLKDQETWVIDESPSGMDTLWIHYGCFVDVLYFVWLLTRKAWLANKVSFKKCMCCRQRLSHRFDIWLRRYHHLLKTFE